MKLACEFPIQYQESLSRETDFDFTLTHLILENEEYRKFYRRQSQFTTRFSILDCSIFELGQALSSEKVMEAADIVDPDVIISPDVLHDAEATCKNLEEFLDKYHSTLKKNKWGVAAVLHGKNLEEIKQTYMHFCQDPLITCICIPFDNILEDLQEVKGDLNHAVNRLRVTAFLESAGIVDVSKKHHLLGVSLPVELLWQKRHSWITSADTSAPIVASMRGVSPFEVESKLIRPDNYFEYEYDECICQAWSGDLKYFQERLR